MRLKNIYKGISNYERCNLLLNELSYTPNSYMCCGLGVNAVRELLV